MTVYETVGKNQQTTLSVLHHTNAAILDMLKPAVAAFEPYVKAAGDLPAVDSLPASGEVVNQWFDFLDALLKEERGFLLGVAGLLSEHKPQRPAVKPTAKAA